MTGATGCCCCCCPGVPAAARETEGAAGRTLARMGVVGSILRVCFGLTMAVAMLVNAAICKLLLLCSCLPERTRGGMALVTTQCAFALTLFLSPWVWITGEPDKSEMWAEIQKQLDSEDPRPVFLLGNHTSFLDTLLTVGTCTHTLSSLLAAFRQTSWCVVLRFR